MAKLNGVKTIDMVNGEITKVTYDGAEYVLTKGGEASLGDLVLVTDDTWVDSTKGAFYKTEKLRDGKYPRLIDDIGELDSNFYDGSYEVFRKISAQTPTPTIGARVEALEADVATIKGEQTAPVIPQVILAKEGDEVTINFAQWSERGTLLDLTEGKRYKVVNLSDGLNILDDKGEERNLFVANPSVVSVVTAPVIPQVGDVVTFEGFDGEYRKVEREAQAGDVVVIAKDDGNLREWFTVGKAYEVTLKSGNAVIVDDVGDWAYVYFRSFGRTPETVDVFEKVEAQYVPQKGDIVVVTAKGTHDYSEGDVVKIDAELSVANGGQASTVRLYGETPDCCYVFANEVRKATPAEVVAYEKAVHKASFSVGDYVKLVNSKRENNGAICVISDIVGGSLPVKLRHISGKFPETTSYATYDQIVKATEQEVADASKPKLKAGDFVKITRKHSWYNPDKIYEVKANQHGELCVIDEDGDENPSAFRKGEYVLATVEEVAKHVDEAKLAKIGRKVGEFKKGDIVRVNSGSTYGHSKGTIGELVSGDCFAFKREFGVLANGRTYDHTTTGFTLVSPVESTLK